MRSASVMDGMMAANRERQRDGGGRPRDEGAQGEGDEEEGVVGISLLRSLQLPRMPSSTQSALDSLASAGVTAGGWGYGGGQATAGTGAVTAAGERGRGEEGGWGCEGEGEGT